MAEAAGCLYALSEVERTVLTLRAGLNGNRTHSRAATARRLGVTPAHVGQVEGRAVSKLRVLSRKGGCGVSAGGAGQGSIGAFEFTSSLGLVKPAWTAVDAVGRDRRPIELAHPLGDRVGPWLNAGPDGAPRTGPDWLIAMLLVLIIALCVLTRELRQLR